MDELEHMDQRLVEVAVVSTLFRPDVADRILDHPGAHMKAIWKYPFNVTDEISISMPSGAEVLWVAPQQIGGQEMPCMWVLVDPGNEDVERRFRLFGTGHDVPDVFTRRSEMQPSGFTNPYVGSFMLLDGRFVGHVFEVLA